MYNTPHDQGVRGVLGLKDESGRSVLSGSVRYQQAVTLMAMMAGPNPPEIVMLGDFIDGPPSMPDLTGKRLLVIPDLHIADFPTAQRSARLSDAAK